MGDRGRKVRATCHACGHSPSVPAELAGKKIRCPECDRSIRVPEDLSGSDTNPLALGAPRRARDEASGRDRGKARDEASGRDRGKARDEASGRDRRKARDEASGRDRGKPRDEASGRDRGKPRDEASGKDRERGRARDEALARPESPPPTPAPAPSEVSVERPRNPAFSARVWVLVLLLIPLVVSLCTPRDGSAKEILERIHATAKRASPEIEFRVNRLMEDEATTMDDILAALPDSRIDGALFSRETHAHWGIALAAAIAFLAATPLLFPRGGETRFELLTIAFYTATAGILMLIGFQKVAFSSTSWRGDNPFTWIVRLIAYCYQLAEGHDDNILKSMIGFTCGVGLCEEVTKALPMILHVTKRREFEWRKACLWGLASGIGFGVAEGILYSGRTYNGVDGPGIYAVRFLSCVGLHGLWAAAGCISISLDQKRIADARSIKTLASCVARALAAPIILHGFYDTLLKKDSYLFATVCAIGSFGWLVSEIDRAYKTETKALPVTS